MKKEVVDEWNGRQIDNLIRKMKIQIDSEIG